MAVTRTRIRPPFVPGAPTRYPPTPFHRWALIKTVLGLVVRIYSRPEVEGLERLPAGPVILCFSHQNWIDPFYFVAALPKRPRLYFFGPEQEDMTRGARNRIISWGGVAIPYKPGRRGLVAATYGVSAAIRTGASVAIAGEGRIHSGESVILPLLEGPAYFALRTGVPIVPLAINGTSWLRFRGRVRVSIGDPIVPAPEDVRRRSETAVRSLTAATQASLRELCSDFPDEPPPGPLERRLTELFNDWPEGDRPPVPAATNPRDEVLR